MTALRPDVEEDLHAAFTAHGKRFGKLDKALAGLAVLLPYVIVRTVAVPGLAVAALGIALLVVAIYLRGVPGREAPHADRVVDAIRDRPDEVATIAHDQTRITIGLADGEAATMRMPPMRALKMVDLLAKRCPRAKVSSAVGYLPPARVVD